MNAHNKKIVLISRRGPIAIEESLIRHTLEDRERRKRITRSMLLAMTLTVFIIVPWLLCPVSAGGADMLDQSQPASQSPTNVGYSDYQKAQIFTAGMYGVLDRVSLRLENWPYNPTGAVLNVSVQTVIGGLPSGKQIGSGTIPLNALPAYGSGGDWVDVSIRGAVLTAGTQYALVLHTSIWNAKVDWWYAYQNQYGSSYTRGVMAFNFGDGWITDGMNDFTFRTYVIPDVLDQYQLYTYAYGSSPHGSTMAQTFTAGLSGVLDHVRVYIENVGYQSYPAALFKASIQTVTGGYPSGTVIGQGSIIDNADTIPFSGAWVDVDISGAVVTAGTKYALVLQKEAGEFVWFHTSPYNGVDEYTGGDMFFNYGTGWTVKEYPSSVVPVDSMFETYMTTPVTYSPPPPPPQTSTPCSGGVCPAVTGNITPEDSTASVTSNVQFRERPDGTVHGILNFNDSRTGDLQLKGCVTESAACLLSVTTFACTDEHEITVAGTYTPKGEAAEHYLLTLSGVRDGIGTFTLTVGDYTYTVTLDGIVEVTCPPNATP